jgi:SAM-dependent methyltransferase
MTDSLSSVDWDLYDFVDLGCSNGGSIWHGMKRFGGQRGIGIDIDPRKVQNTRDAGFEAVVADARDLDLERRVSFITMLDFFEHLPDAWTVEQIIAAAARSARDFLYIKHPSFEGQELSEHQGVRQYWWDWHGHTAHIRVADYCSMFDRLGLRQYFIRYVERIDDSTHPSIIPTSMPRDCSAEEAAAVTDVPFVRFSPPLWRRQDIFVALRPFETGEWRELTKAAPSDLVAMRRSGQTEYDPVAYDHVAPPPKRSAA